MKTKSIIFFILLVIIAVLAFYIGSKYNKAPIETPPVTETQVATTTDSGTDNDGMEDEHAFLQADYNFDGYPDRLKMLDCGATGNCDYEVEFYNPTTKTYAPMSGVGEETFTLINPVVNKEEQLACSYANTGAGSYYLGIYRFAVSAKGFVLVKELSGNSDKVHGCTLK